jgi:hypothetical protein
MVDGLVQWPGGIAVVDPFGLRNSWKAARHGLGTRRLKHALLWQVHPLQQTDKPWVFSQGLGEVVPMQIREVWISGLEGSFKPKEGLSACPARSNISAIWL